MQEKNIDDELPEDVLKRMRPARDVLPPSFFEGMAELKAKRARGRPKIDAPKRVKSFKLSPDVIDGIMASGPGYNTRVEAVLRQALIDGRI